ncbi:MAG: hypothetical protein MJ014_00055 [Methanocorpusculum sp.]|nr:hypothetical protein [Methanocorpusculum sp.]
MSEKDFIECLGVCDAQYTSDTINTEGLYDVRIPPMLRATAMSPFEGVLCKEIYKDSNTAMLGHASAVIPATGRGFWVVYPYHYDTLNYDDKSYREMLAQNSRKAVRYYPPNNTGSGDFVTSHVNDLYYTETLVGKATEFTLYTDKLMKGGHPCGATYLNMPVQIELSKEAIKVLEGTSLYTKSTWGEFQKSITEFFAQPGVRSGGSSDPCVDVLICCGGYHWIHAKTETSKKFWAVGDGSIRFFTATPRIIIDSTKDNEKMTYDPARILWQTIYMPAGQVPHMTAPLCVRIGASVISVRGKNGENGFRCVGGFAPRFNTPDGGPGDIPDANFVHSHGSGCVPWNEYEFKAVISSTDFTVDEKTVHVLHLQIAVTKKQEYYDYGSGSKRYTCFNPIDKTTISTTVTDAHDNTAPWMYPVLYNINGNMIGYGAEWVGWRSEADANVYLLSHYIRGWFNGEGQQQTADARVCHIPLLTTQYLFRKAGDETLRAYPLNLSGGIAMSEGGAAVPSKDGKSLIVLGGCTSKYGEHSFAVREGLSDTKKRYEYLPTLKEIRSSLMAPTYREDEIHLIQWSSKIITPETVSYAKPFTWGIDTLIHDSLFSQCVQLGDSDYFVLPSSYMTYTDEEKYSPNAVLLKRVVPQGSDSDMQLHEYESDDDIIAAHVKAFSHVYVSQVLGLPVYQETRETYADETPCCYGRASVAKNSIGAVPDMIDGGKGYWLYRLGNGTEPAVYYHIVTLKNVKCVSPLKMGLASDEWDTPVVQTDGQDDPGLPEDWIR